MIRMTGLAGSAVVGAAHAWIRSSDVKASPMRVDTKSYAFYAEIGGLVAGYFLPNFWRNRMADEVGEGIAYASAGLLADRAGDTIFKVKPTYAPAPYMAQPYAARPAAYAAPLAAPSMNGASGYVGRRQAVLR